MNSEIIGQPTDVPWAFVFERVDMLPRHPAQLYEAIAYFIFFLGMVYLYKRGQQKREKASLPYHRGFFFGLCLTKISRISEFTSCSSTARKRQENNIPATLKKFQGMKPTVPPEETESSMP